MKNLTSKSGSKPVLNKLKANSVNSNKCNNIVSSAPICKSFEQNQRQNPALEHAFELQFHSLESLGKHSELK